MPMSPYVRRLRDAVGNDLLLLPSVTVLPRDADDRLLLVRQADHGRWGLLGGAMDPGESPAESAVREVREEIGVDVVLGPIIGVLSGPKYEIEYDDGDRNAYVTIVFGPCRLDGEIVPDGEEVLEARWFSPAELSTADLHPFSRAALEELGLLSTT